MNREIFVEPAVEPSFVQVQICVPLGRCSIPDRRPHEAKLRGREAFTTADKVPIRDIAININPYCIRVLFFIGIYLECKEF